MNTATRPATIAFTVLGRPVGKERARVVNGRAYTPERTRDYERMVGTYAALTLRDQPMLTGDISLSIRVYVSGGTFADVDNYAKSISDAIQGVLFENDKQVSELHVTRYACRRGDERIEVVVQERVS